MKHVKALLILSMVLGCSDLKPTPYVEIPDQLLASVNQPVMRGTTEGDVWQLISRQQGAIATANSKLAAISCIYAANKAIRAGDPAPECHEELVQVDS